MQVIPSNDSLQHRFFPSSEILQTVLAVKGQLRRAKPPRPWALRAVLGTVSQDEGNVTERKRRFRHGEQPALTLDGVARVLNFGRGSYLKMCG